ncbi:sulfite exporter TauE/SafE family protein [Paenarthrobacter sp. RAF54_2]|uniref:sulfite exporter TauE/SafE family protein n=1 Tax=Paenarthrobacter sp. RAF54_2 TaxID=3233061 RepID=UPI003F98FB63
MSPWYAGVLFVAGIGGGLAGSIAGLASLSTYPALLGLGLVPVSANVTNTAALILNGVGSALGSAPELKGQAGALRRLIPMGILGGAGGALLLLSIPPGYFEYLVPVILASAAVVIAIPRRLASPSGRPQGPLKSAAMLTICIQGGFFGAAAGVMLLAVLMSSGTGSMARANAVKNVVLGAANLSATLIFIAFAPINWVAAMILGLGCLIGSRLGPPLVRTIPETPLRLLIAAAGITLALKLGIETYR